MVLTTMYPIVQIVGMPRKPRIEYAGAVYHVLNRGDQGDRVFKDELDVDNFLSLLGKTAGQCGWVLHAYCLMPNHFHLLLETREANLVAGMKWFMGGYTQAYNRRHGLRGHLFQGRYKALPVESGEGGYFEKVSTYIHLNPARAGLLRRESPILAEYKRSSYPVFLDRKARPEWLEVKRVLGNLGLKDDGHGRDAYGRYMQERLIELRTKKGRKLYAGLWKGIRHGWCIGGESFEAEMLGRLKTSVAAGQRESYSGVEMVKHDEGEAERLVRAGMKVLRLGNEELERMRNGALEKKLLAWLVKSRAMVSHRWMTDRLKMGVAANVGKYVKDASRDKHPDIAHLRERLANV